MEDARRTEVLRHILQLFLDRELVELLAERELAVDTLLRDVEVLHVEEAVLANALDERLRELLLALRGGIKTEVERDKVRPVQIFL